MGDIATTTKAEFLKALEDLAGKGELARLAAYYTIALDEESRSHIKAVLLKGMKACAGKGEIVNILRLQPFEGYLPQEFGTAFYASLGDASRTASAKGRPGAMMNVTNQFRPVTFREYTIEQEGKKEAYSFDRPTDSFFGVDDSAKSIEAYLRHRGGISPPLNWLQTMEWEPKEIASPHRKRPAPGRHKLRH